MTRKKKNIKKNIRTRLKERKRKENIQRTETEKRTVAEEIKKHWKDASMAIAKEMTRHTADILVEKDDLKIPIEVKTRSNGRFYLLGNKVVYEPYDIGRKKESFPSQVHDHLSLYGVSVFCVNLDVVPGSPSYVDITRSYFYGKGGRLILSHSSDVAEALELAYEFLKNQPIVDQI